MHSTSNAQSFVPFANDYSPPRSRTTAGSIWAPQPQPLESAWPNAIDNFSRDVEKAALATNRPQNGLQGFNPTFASEDVFGPVGLVGPPRKRDIGAIGDGRKRQSPEFEDNASLFRFFSTHILAFYAHILILQHVEQLLRALNLNSPAPYAPQPPRSHDGEPMSLLSGSPDLSPSSTTSALLTPTDLSPAKSSFDLKITPPYEVPSVPSNVSPNSLLFDPGSPLRTRNFMSSVHNSHPRYPGAQVSCVMSSNNFPSFDQSSENPSSAIAIQSLYDSAFPQLCRRPELPHIPSMTWRQQQLAAPTEWLRSEDRPGNDYSSSLSGEDTLRTSPSQLSFSPRQGSAGAHSHEVRELYIDAYTH